MTTQALPQIRFAYNDKRKNKDEWKGKYNYELLATGYRDTQGTLEDVKKHVLAGHAMCFGLLGGNRRKKANVIGSQMVFLDIDNTKIVTNPETGKDEKVYDEKLTLEQALVHPYVVDHCAWIYTTPSHKPTHNKFRLIFLLPEVETDIEVLSALLELLADILPHDRECMDVGRPYYGNTKAEHYNFNPHALIPSELVERARVLAVENKAKKEVARLKREDDLKNTMGWQGSSEEAKAKFVADAREALTFVPKRVVKGNNYFQCIRILMALHSAFGTDLAEELCEEWSPSESEGWDVRSYLEGFDKNPREGITILTLFEVAREHGYKEGVAWLPEHGSEIPKEEFERRRAATQVSSTQASVAPQEPVYTGSQPDVNTLDNVVPINQKRTSPTTVAGLVAELDSLGLLSIPASEVTGKINSLAKRMGVPVAEIRAMYNQRMAERDLIDTRVDRSADVDELLAASGASIDIRSVLPVAIAEPLCKLAGWLNLKPVVYLSALLTNVSVLHKVGTEVVLHYDWKFKVTPNLYTAIVAPSSQKKSPILREMINEPMQPLNAAARKEFKEAVERYKVDIARYKSLKKEQQQEEFPQGEPEKPRQRVYSISATTGEGLFYQVATFPQQGLLYLKDELAGLFKSANQYRGGRGSDEEDLLSYYDGTGGTILRADGVRADVSNLLLGILGTIQPEVLRNFLRDCSDANGNWARFIFVNQPLAASKMTVDGGSFNLTPLLSDLYAKIDALPPTVYRLERKAAEYFCEIYDQLEYRRVHDTSQSGLSSVWGKSQGRIGKLALNLHCIHEVLASRQPSEAIPLARVEEATRLTLFYAEQIRALYLQFSDSGTLTPHLAKIVELSRRKGWIKTRDVQQSSGGRNRPSSDTVREWFQDLAAMGRGQLKGETRALEFLVVEATAENSEPDISPTSLVVETPLNKSSFVGDVGDLLATPPTGFDHTTAGLQTFVGIVGDVGDFPEKTENCVFSLSEEVEDKTASENKIDTSRQQRQQCQQTGCNPLPESDTFVGDSPTNRQQTANKLPTVETTSSPVPLSTNQSTTQLTTAKQSRKQKDKVAPGQFSLFDLPVAPASDNALPDATPTDCADDIREVVALPPASYDPRCAITHLPGKVEVDLSRIDLAYTPAMDVPEWKPSRSLPPYESVSKIYLDLETSGLNPQCGRVLMAGLMDGDGKTYIFTNEGDFPEKTENCVFSLSEEVEDKTASENKIDTSRQQRQQCQQTGCNPLPESDTFVGDSPTNRQQTANKLPTVETTSSPVPLSTNQSTTQLTTAKQSRKQKDKVAPGQFSLFDLPVAPASDNALPDATPTDCADDIREVVALPPASYDPRCAITHLPGKVEVDLSRIDLAYTPAMDVPEWKPSRSLPPYESVSKIYLDLETSGLNPQCGRVLMAGLMDGDGKTYIFTNEGDFPEKTENCVFSLSEEVEDKTASENKIDTSRQQRQQCQQTGCNPLPESDTFVGDSPTNRQQTANKLPTVETTSSPVPLSTNQSTTQLTTAKQSRKQKDKVAPGQFSLFDLPVAPASDNALPDATPTDCADDIREVVALPPASYDPRCAITHLPGKVEVDLSRIDLAYTPAMDVPEWKPSRSLPPYESVSKIYLDLETSGLNPQCGRVLMAGLMDGDGKTYIFTNEDEAQLLTELFRFLRSNQPKMLIGYNVFDFDLNFLLVRCRTHKVPCPFNKAYNSKKITASAVHGKPIEFTPMFWRGTDILDAYHQVGVTDKGLAIFSGYSLKDAVLTLKLRSERRLELSHTQIQEYWHKGELEPIEEYLVYDLEDTKLLSDFLFPGVYYQGEIVPRMSTQQLSYDSPALKWEFIYESLYPGKPFPVADDKVAYPGASCSCTPGLYQNCSKVDVNSLYPSLQVRYHLISKKDTEHKAVAVTKYLLERRLELKRQAKETGDTQATHQAHALKIIANSGTGFLGVGFYHYNDMEAATLVTAYGAKVLQLMMRTIEQHGGTLIECDTDGIIFNNADPQVIRAEINKALPDGISVSLDFTNTGVYVPLLKNYLLFTPDGEVKTVGAFRKRDKSKLQKTFPVEFIRRYLQSPDEAERYYQELRELIESDTCNTDWFMVRQKIRKGDKALSGAGLGAEGDIVNYYYTKFERVSEKTGKKLKAKNVATTTELYWAEHYVNELDNIHMKIMTTIVANETQITEEVQ